MTFNISKSENIAGHTSYSPGTVRAPDIEVWKTIPLFRRPS